ncbi:hypothetical protein PENSPDRAFT_503379 [Peniophora sp. CONT]|nr:hypothetical protein PENSPDRAFT_503379 [Peniophora sp. CONT]
MPQAIVGAAYVLRVITYARRVPEEGELLRGRGFKNGFLELERVEGSIQAQDAAELGVEDVKEELDLDGMNREPPVDTVQTEAHAHSTPTPAPEPSASKPTTTKRAGKPTSHDLLRMALCIANNGDEEPHAAGDWQAFGITDVRNQHRNLTESWAKILYENHSDAAVTYTSEGSCAA